MTENTNNLPEAGGIAFCELFGTKTDSEGVKHLVKINITSRGLNTRAALDDLLLTISYASKELHLFPYNPYDKIPQSAPAEQAEQAAPAAPAAALAAPAPAEPVYENIDQVNKTMVNKMSITPQADGKVKLAFYETGNRYPSFYWTGAPEAAVQLLISTGNAWSTAHFQKAGEYMVEYQIEYKLSTKLNSKGNPYKNIVRISKA